MILQLLGKTAGFLTRHWGKALLAGIATDGYFNEFGHTKTAGEKASGFLSEKAEEVARKGIGNVFDETVNSIETGIENTLGTGELGNMVKGHWGKLIVGALSLGLLGSGNTSLGLFLGLGLAAYVAYNHYATNGFNMAASGQNAAPAVSQETQILPNLAAMQQQNGALVAGSQQYGPKITTDANASELAPQQQ